MHNYIYVVTSIINNPILVFGCLYPYNNTNIITLIITIAVTIRNDITVILAITGVDVDDDDDWTTVGVLAVVVGVLAVVVVVDVVVDVVVGTAEE